MRENGNNGNDLISYVQINLYLYYKIAIVMDESVVSSQSASQSVDPISLVLINLIK